jgi:hypothetical protein
MSDQSLWVVSSVKRFFVALALLCWLMCMAPATRAATDPGQGPGGPILIITSGSSTFGKYYAEILRTEGFNAFAVSDISAVSASALASYDLVLLAKVALTSTQVTMLSNWVNGGGNLIAMAPDTKLAGLLGIGAAAGAVSDGYLLVDTSVSPGNGIVGQTMQFHGAASLYNLSGASQLAALYSTATTAAGKPAVTLRNAGSGKAIHFGLHKSAMALHPFARTTSSMATPLAMCAPTGST